MESFANSVCFGEPKDIRRYLELFDNLRALAVGPPETRVRLQQLIRELK